jgi:hypothetical protein
LTNLENKKAKSIRIFSGRNGRAWSANLKMVWYVLLPYLGRYNIIDIISYHYITFSRILIFFISFFKR